jgi:K+-transporting ATPase ATPase A chain
MRCFSSGRAPQTLGPYVETTTRRRKQTIAVGPVASQIAIKMLGLNGGGFFNANAAHPFRGTQRAVELRAR